MQTPFCPSPERTKMETAEDIYNDLILRTKERCKNTVYVPAINIRGRALKGVFSYLDPLTGFQYWFHQQRVFLVTKARG
jgi:hypothetical protein